LVGLGYGLCTASVRHAVEGGSSLNLLGNRDSLAGLIAPSYHRVEAIVGVRYTETTNRADSLSASNKKNKSKSCRLALLLSSTKKDTQL
jgi:hypothetical protein